MSTRIRKNPDIRKQEIIAVARDLIAEHGHEKVSVSEVARQVGVSKAAVYFYYDSKEALFREVIFQEVKGPMEAALELYEEDLPLPEKMARILAVSFALKVYRPKNINHLIESAQGLAAELVNEDVAKFLSLFESLFQTAHKTGVVDLDKNFKGDARLAAELLVTATHGIVIAGSERLKAESHEERVALLVTTFLRGM